MGRVGSGFGAGASDVLETAAVAGLVGCGSRARLAPRDTLRRPAAPTAGRDRPVESTHDQPVAVEPGVLGDPPHPHVRLVAQRVARHAGVLRRHGQLVELGGLLWLVGERGLDPEVGFGAQLVVLVNVEHPGVLDGRLRTGPDDGWVGLEVHAGNREVVEQTLLDD